MWKETIYKPKRRCLITELIDGETIKLECTFHDFGLDIETTYTDDGNYAVASYSTGIVETDGGQVKNIPVENIKFINEEEK